jgi:hypothetical protein
MCSPVLEVDGGERNPAGGGRPQAGSVSPAATALRRFPSRGKRLRRCGSMSRSRRWRRLALGGGDRDESTSAAHRPTTAVLQFRQRRAGRARARGRAHRLYRGTGREEPQERMPYRRRRRPWLSRPVSHPILQGKPNASHMCTRIKITHT